MQQAKCSKCGIIKTPENSFLRPDRSDKYQAYCKDCNNKNTLRRQREFKQKCVEYKGFKCSICGYNKCIAALEFHHRDPSEKDFTIGQNRNYSLKVMEEIIYPELDKCELVCSNCHKEIHFTGTPEEASVRKYPKKYFCIDCNSEISVSSDRCLKCNANNRFKGPSKQQLEQDLIELKNNKCAIARKYKVSEAAVRKWIKKYSIN